MKNLKLIVLCSFCCTLLLTTTAFAATSVTTKQGVGAKNSVYRLASSPTESIKVYPVISGTDFKARFGDAVAEWAIGRVDQSTNYESQSKIGGDSFIPPSLFWDYTTIDMLMLFTNCVVRGTVVEAWQDANKYGVRDIPEGAVYEDPNEYYLLKVDEVICGRAVGGTIEVGSFLNVMKVGGTYACFLDIRNSASWEGERIGLTDYDSVFPIKNEMVSYPAKYDSPAISYEEFKDVVVEAQEVALAILEAQEKALAEELANQSLFEKSDLVLIATVAGKDVAGDVVVCSLEDIQAVKGGIISTQMYNVPLPKSVEVGKTYMILMKEKKNGGYEIADKDGAVLEKGTPKFLEYAQNAG